MTGVSHLTLFLSRDVKTISMNLTFIMLSDKEATSAPEDVGDMAHFVARNVPGDSVVEMVRQRTTTHR
jgi:hypothetical protein